MTTAIIAGNGQRSRYRTGSASPFRYLPIHMQGPSRVAGRFRESFGPSGWLGNCREPGCAASCRAGERDCSQPAAGVAGQAGDHQGCVAGRRVEPRPSIGLDPGIPVVYAMTQSMDSDEPAILPDDTGGGRLAAEHLLSLGRRRFGHITGP